MAIKLTTKAWSPKETLTYEAQGQGTLLTTKELLTIPPSEYEEEVEQNMSTPGTKLFTERDPENTTLLKNSLVRRSEHFDYCLDTLVALIRKLATDKTVESAIELSRLRKVIKGRPDPSEINCLLPAISAALATRVEALMELQYDNLDNFLDAFAENMRGLVTGQPFKSLMGLQRLRSQIKESGDGQASRWLVGSIDAILGKRDYLVWK